ncbi:DUF1801 domain-containing protein [Vallicoccus soli]|uniref:DUF1801 domain-containing protein n=1 Tax=Vallicoccus soli TaxID=2339232 RepID=A0A3A3YTH8_9ACTN|nr:DUF1801 domain-containing protein [Vallicoccus soli]RJK94745.1 DUF1801 domain-containing protein [Vallicoccus soli]
MSRTDGSTTSSGLSERELAAVRERAAELRQESGSGGKGAKGAKDEAAVLAKIEQMAEPDRSTALRLHRLVADAAPDLRPKLWYGQPAYARGGKVVCFFRSGQDDGERYSTFGFTPEARLDDGSGAWPTSYAVADLTEAAAEALAALVARA